MHITSALTKYPHPQLASLHKLGKPGPAQAKSVLNAAKGDPATPVTLTKNKMAPSKPQLLTNIKRPGVPGKIRVPQGNEPAALIRSKPAFTGRPVTLDHPAEVQKDPSSPPSGVDQLLEDWGQRGSPWDLNGDGTVGMMDLLTLLARMAPGSTTDEAPNVDVAPSIGPSSGITPAPGPNPSITPAPQTVPHPQDDQSPAQSRLDELLNAWGQTDSPYDLNGDGTVDFYDLSLLLGMMAGGSQPTEEPQDDVGSIPRPAAAMAAKLTSTIFTSRDRDHDGVLTAKDLPGADPLFKRLDRDDDGGITKRELHGAIAHSFRAALASSEKPDLSRVVQRWLAAFGLHKHGSELEGPEKPAGHVTRPLRAARHRAAAEHLARSLAPQLASSSPTEIRRVVDGSNVGMAQKKLILDRLTAWHPRGLNISKVG